MTEQPKNQSPQSDSLHESETLYLKEALRLSELQLTEQNKTFDTIERKVTLLVTLCIAIISYFASSGMPEDKVATVSLIIIVAALTIATGGGAFVLLTRSFAIPGANPAYSTQEFFEGDFAKMADDLLKRYEKRFLFNEKQLARKILGFKLSFLSGAAGIFSACIWIIFFKLGLMSQIL